MKKLEQLEEERQFTETAREADTKKKKRVILDNNVFPKAIVFASSPWSHSSSPCLSPTLAAMLAVPRASVTGIHRVLWREHCGYSASIPSVSPPPAPVSFPALQGSLFSPREAGTSEAALTEEGSQTGYARMASWLTAVAWTAGPPAPCLREAPYSHVWAYRAWVIRVKVVLCHST